MTEHDAVPETLRALFAAERSAPVADLATKSVVRAKLAATVGAAPLGAAAAASTGAFVVGAKVIVVIALAVGIGALATRDRTPDPVRRETVAIATPTPAGLPSAASIEPTIALADPIADPIVEPIEDSITTTPTAAPRPSPSAKRHAKITPPTPMAAIAPTETIPTQAELLRDAWSAMSSGNPARALLLVTRDEQLHPHGSLVEERDALAIDALARLKRYDEARAARDAFLARYPTSIHRARLRVLDAEETSR